MMIRGGRWIHMKYQTAHWMLVVQQPQLTLFPCPAQIMILKFWLRLHLLLPQKAERYFLTAHQYPQILELKLLRAKKDSGRGYGVFFLRI
uniref:Uncharacterized protein n=1 Tax=Arundo donax TaxID=35708 RepID=A0A0A9D6J3_ARUDO